ncbi:hypothetical protein F5I97DRAFT_1800282 [Phlebopus sp. FC_14]|nr:hypothetical protein F5I97DRAFT_1800282 [Phlebopus sp. FC_14]
MVSSNVFFEESRKRSAQDLLHRGLDESGYIEGKIFMIWPSRNSVRRLKIETTDDFGIHRFEVDIHSRFLENRDGLALRAHDHIRIALKGAKADVRKESSAPHYFPVVLKYNDGIAIECLSGVHRGMLINTWEGKNDRNLNWYDPGAVHPVSEVMMADATAAVSSQSTLSQPHALAQSAQEGLLEWQNLLHNDSNTVHCKPNDGVSLRSSTTLSKAQRKRRKRGARYRLASGAGVAHGPVTQHALVCVKSGTSNQMPHLAPPEIPSHDVSDEIIPQTISPMAAPVSPGTTGTLAPDSVDAVDAEPLDPAVHLKAGIRTEMGDTFTALSDLRKGYAMINIIGVVTSVQGEKRTRTNEWSRSFALVDPSNVDSGSVTVNCFQKKYLEWLPQVNQDDVVILRKLKISEWNGKVAALGYGDKLRWAIYDSVTHGTRPPGKGEAPHGEGSDDGFGYYYSPYWTPTVNGTELGYCAQIAAWWKTFKERSTRNVVSVQPGPSKVHHLLCDVSPSLNPMGFFNCTVEILQIFENDRGPCTVYATDYTSNLHVQPIRATWCRSELQTYAFRFEMWDAAKEIARIMIPGEYWYFHNARAKWSGNHYMEGTMREAEKVFQLDEAHLENLPHLKALLMRKKGLSEAANKPTGPSNSLPSILLQDVDQRTVLFTCTLLHLDLDSRDDPSIYVTDYTFRHDLPACLSKADWSRGLDHRIVMIKLDDSQRRRAQELRPGSFYKIVNLRLIQRGRTSNAYCRLGGEDRLIFPLYDQSSECGQTLKRCLSCQCEFCSS